MVYGDVSRKEEGMERVCGQTGSSGLEQTVLSNKHDTRGMKYTNMCFYR